MEKLTDKQLTELPINYMKLFDTVTDAVYLIKNNNIIDVNLGTVKMYGYDKDEIIGEPPAILLASSKKYIDKFNEKIIKAKSGEVQRFRLWGKRKNGKTFPKDVCFNRSEQLDKKIIVVTARDISKRVETEKKLSLALKRAENSEKIKSEFLAQISHEIRTPLNVIFSYTGFLKELIGEEKKEEYKDIFRGIKSASDRLSRTINSILDMVAIQSDMLEVELKTINLQHVLDNIYKSFSSISHFKRLKFEIINEIGEVFIDGDEYTISNLFENLVDNAFKYTDKGGIQIRIFQSGEDVVNVEIKDTGIGISESYLPYIFKPFTQESTGYSRNYEGSGLGLALVKNYANLCRATIKVTSILNRGSIFTVSLKKNQPKPV